MAAIVIMYGLWSRICWHTRIDHMHLKITAKYVSSVVVFKLLQFNEDNFITARRNTVNLLDPAGLLLTK
jgi:hypothetical protein